MPPHQKLERKLGLFTVTNIVIANMIGAGIFTTSGLLMSELKDPMLLIVLWAVGGIIALCGALCYGELGAAYPRAGGEYAFLSELYSPMTGFLSGWVSFVVGFSAPIAASSIGFSEYLYRALPGAFTITGVEPDTIKTIISIAIICIFTLIHLRGTSIGSVVQNALTLLKVLLVVGLILIGFGFGAGDWGQFRPAATASGSPAGLKTIALSLMWIMFAYSGWNASVYIGSEIKQPQKNLPRSLLIGTGSVAILYLLLNVLFIYAIGPDEMQGVISIGGLAVGKLFGATMESIFSLLLAIALFSSISAFIILGPRVYFAMAEKGHFFKFAGYVHPKFKVPTLSIIFQAIISVVIVLTGTLDQIFTYMGFALGIFPLLAVAGLFILRRSGNASIRLPGFPVTAIIFLVVNTAILVLAFLERPVESCVAIATVLAGVPAYLLFRTTVAKS